MTTESGPLRIGIDPALAQSSAEIKYTFRTLLRIAGYPYEFRWVDAAELGPAVDIYYGQHHTCAASIFIRASGKPFTAAEGLEPRALGDSENSTCLILDSAAPGSYIRSRDQFEFTHDLILTCYWLLTGAGEARYSRDRWDNFDLGDSFLIRNSLASAPLVSMYGTWLRNHFQRLGKTPLALPWNSGSKRAAFALTHDVDYPEIIRSIECLRLARTRGLGSVKSIREVLNGTSHFWKFSDWVEFAKSFNTRPAFYFMARRGSLTQYALGTPDAFYDIRSPRFRELFRELRDQGCEIGLHASYNAYRSAETYRNEKQALEEIAGTAIVGNRNHYWHLDPLVPHETLYRQQQAGLLYDSSLEFEFYPGFRRGIAHPFHVFHLGERRELKILELPPAWMDDQFDRRRLQNGISDCVGYARNLVRAAQQTGGVIIVDYHQRGMNHDFYPRYGAWLMDFMTKHLDSTVGFHTPQELARQYLAYETQLESASLDACEPAAPVLIPSQPQTVSVINIDLLQLSEHAQWDAFVAAHPQGNIYHTLAWQVVEQEGFGHSAHYLRAVRDGEFVGVLPLFLVKGIFGRRLVSVPLRDRGGLLAVDADVAGRLLASARELARTLRCDYLELRSLDELDPDVARQQELECIKYWTTTRIDLAPGTQKLWKRLDRESVRWAIGKAHRSGVQVSIDDSERGIEQFYSLFVKTRSAMGIPPFPKRFFVSMWTHLIRQGRAKLFMESCGSELIHGMVCLLSKDTFIPAYAAPQNQWRKKFINEVMIWHTIEWASENGFRYYDFGADSPRQTGLLHFKEKWGGVPHPVPYYFYSTRGSTLPNFDSSTPGYELMRKIWKRMPTALSQPLGGWVTRQLS
ncbi:MAG: GNAT family N-acetyltransferase [Anaerolineae bacterium]|nr:GNAT family N-acetyltransferase [Anaerolineae bacterium]